MKIYLDTCSLQRPLDSKGQIRVALESEAVVMIIELCESQKLELISSEPLRFEQTKNTDPARREFMQQTLSMATEFVESTDAVKQRALMFMGYGIQLLDALHLSSAVEGKAEYFCTTDDRFYKRAKELGLAKPQIVTPLQLLEETQNDT